MHRLPDLMMTPLRAGMPQAIEAEIRSRGRIVGPVALRAVARIGALVRHDRDGGAFIIAVVVVSVVVAWAVIIIRAAVIGVGVGGERAADHGAGNRAGEEATVMMMEVTAAPAAAIPDRTAATPIAAAVKADRRSR